MYRLVRILTISAALLMSMFVTACTSPLSNAKSDFDLDADLARLEHLVYWTGLIEEYEAKVGHLPFYDQLEKEIGLVRIGTKAQAQYYTPSSAKYIPELDSNGRGYFQEFSMAEFISELEQGLGRTIDEKYDIQYVPDGNPIWYHYFITEDGYLMWVACATCGVTQVSTLLTNGYTATVNIGSPAMVAEIPKALTRDAMLSHPTFIDWTSRDLKKEGFVRAREAEHKHDSKTAP